MGARSGLVWCVLVSAAALALLATASPASAGWFGPEQRLTTNAAEQMYPDIYGDTVVFQDKRNGNWDIYLLDLSTGNSRRLTSDAGEQSEPRIWGASVVYDDHRNGTAGDVYFCDASGSGERRLSVNASINQFPSIAGTNVVWVDFRNGKWDIYHFDLATDIERLLPTTTANQYRIGLDGERIVYMGWNAASGANVYLYDLGTDAVTPLTTSGTAGSPDISGTRVVYTDSRSGSLRLYLRDLRTGADKALTGAGDRPASPRIIGSKVFYLTDRNGNTWDVYVHDLVTGIERRLVRTHSLPQGVALSGDRFVYQDARNGNVDIYSRRMVFPKLTATAPAAAVAGARVTVRGTLRTASGMPIAGRRVDLLRSGGGSTWLRSGHATTSQSGRYAIRISVMAKTYYYRASFAGDGRYLGAMSGRLRIVPGT